MTLVCLQPRRHFICTSCVQITRQQFGTMHSPLLLIFLALMVMGGQLVEKMSFVLNAGPCNQHLLLSWSYGSAPAIPDATFVSDLAKLLTCAAQRHASAITAPIQQLTLMTTTTVEQIWMRLALATLPVKNRLFKCFLIYNEFISLPSACDQFGTVSLTWPHIIDTLDLMTLLFLTAKHIPVIAIISPKHHLSDLCCSYC